MKKVLAMLLAAVMVLSLAACGSKTDEGKDNTAGETKSQEATDGETKKQEAEDMTLRVMWWGNQTRTDRTMAALDAYTAEHPNVKFDTQAYNFSDYFAVVATASAGKSLPDVFQTNDTSELLNLVKNDNLLDLTPYIESGALDMSNVDQGIIDAGTVDGGVYAICVGVNVPALIYNKTLLDENGITVKDNMNLDEFMDVCREVYEKTGVKTDLAFGNSTSYLNYIMRGEGNSNFITEEGLTDDDPAQFVPFFEIYETGAKEGWMIDGATYANITLNSVEQAPMVYYSSPATQSWCACNWSNQITAFAAAAGEDVELAMSTWPSNDPAASDFLHPSMYLSVAANSEHPDESVDLVNFFTNSVECNKILLAERGIPVSTVVADAIADDLTDLNRMEINLINEVVTPNSSTKTPIPPDGANEFFVYADQLAEQVVYQQLDAATASSQLFDKAAELFK